MRLILLCGLLITTISAPAQTAFTSISGYAVSYARVVISGKTWIGLRHFQSTGNDYLLLADPETLDTRVIGAQFCQVKTASFAELRRSFSSAAYVKALNRAEQQAADIQDAGITQGAPKETGISLTIDLCPSHKPLDRVVFTSVFRAFQRVEKPAPVAVSVSGLWMLHHGDDLNWLKSMERSGEIAISWINHSYHHRVSSTLPLRENFLLEPGTDVAAEVLLNEQLMLKNDLVPSVFFRFPGLVSDAAVVKRITDFGLIPVGSDAWLAKGQKAASGSIVLIHGNGNEPLGVADFLQLISTEEPLILKRQWLLYDLRETVSDDVQ